MNTIINEIKRLEEELETINCYNEDGSVNEKFATITDQILNLVSLL